MEFISSGIVWIGFLVLFGSIGGVCIYLWFENKSAKKFIQNNPDAATVWIIGQQHIGVNIKKVDEKKAMTFGYGLIASPGGAYMLPGEHVLTLEHGNADPAVNKTPEFKKQKMSQMKIVVEAGKDYILEYGVQPGDYKLVEGKPAGK